VNSTPRVRQPITAYIMRQVKAELLKDQHSYHNIVMWAACSLAFFGFLRSSEFTVPSQDLFDEELHLSLGDLSVDSRAAPQLLRVTIKQSKTDPFRKGVTLTLGKTSNFLCPVEAILPYLAIRGPRPGPLFILNDGTILTQQLFSTFLNNILVALKLKKDHFNTHSFHIGAATSAKEAGMPNVFIKMMGRWRSDSYQRYILVSSDQMVKFSKLLSSEL